MKFDTLSMIYHFTQLSNTSKDTKTATPPTTTSLFLPNSTWTPIPPQGTFNHSTAAIAHTSPFYPMLVPNFK